MVVEITVLGSGACVYRGKRRCALSLDSCPAFSFLVFAPCDLSRATFIAALAFGSFDILILSFYEVLNAVSANHVIGCSLASPVDAQLRQWQCQMTGLCVRLSEAAELDLDISRLWISFVVSTTALFASHEASLLTVLWRSHHTGYICWPAFEARQAVSSPPRIHCAVLLLTLEVSLVLFSDHE